MARIGGNPNLGLESSKGGKSRTEVGKFMSTVKRRDLSKVPPQLVELFEFYQGVKTKQGVDYLIEIQNIIRLLKKSIMPRMIDRLQHGEMINKQELDVFKTLIDAADKSHKLKYGDKKVIERVVSFEDIRKQIFSDKKIINAKVVEDEPVSQDLDRSGRSKGDTEKNRNDDKNNDRSDES